MLNNLSKKEKFLVSVTVIICVLGLYFNFIFIPSITSITNKMSIIEDYNKEILNIENTKNKNEKLNVDLKTLQGKFDETLKKLPYSERVPEIARNIKPLIDKSGAIFGPIGFGKAAEAMFTVPGNKTEKDNKLKLMSFTVSLSETGDYLSLMKLIDYIETDSRITTIDSVAFSPSPTAVAATIGMHYYFLTNSKENIIPYDFGDNVKFGKDNPFK